eukprot:scaffold1237_cov67-Phaeocystis_antarctica.AAC.3
MDESSRQLKRRAHISRLVRIHIGVDQRCRTRDVKPPAKLPTMSTHNRCRAHDGESPAILPTMSKRNVPAGRWMTVQGEHTVSA